MCNWDAGGHEETEEYHLPRIPATHPHLKTLPMCWCDGAGEVKLRDGEENIRGAKYPPLWSQLPRWPP